MKRKWIPVVRLNPHKKLFKWEYDVDVEYINEAGDPPAPRIPRGVVASRLTQPATITYKGAVRKAKRHAESLNRLEEQRHRGWERVSDG